MSDMGCGKGGRERERVGPIFPADCLISLVAKMSTGLGSRLRLLKPTFVGHGKMLRTGCRAAGLLIAVTKGP